MDSDRVRRNRLIFFAVLVGIPAVALVAYFAVSLAAFSSFGS